MAEPDATQTLRALAEGAAVHSAAAAAAAGGATRTAEAEGAEAAEDHDSHDRPTRGGEASNLVSTPTPYNFHERPGVRHKALMTVALLSCKNEPGMNRDSTQRMAGSI